MNPVVVGRRLQRLTRLPWFVFVCILHASLIALTTSLSTLLPVFFFALLTGYLLLILVFGLLRIFFVKFTSYRAKDTLIALAIVSSHVQRNTRRIASTYCRDLGRLIVYAHVANPFICTAKSPDTVTGLVHSEFAISTA